ncbi:hypothetical protein ABPG74_020916 [Tetrahymena malaccensis]
MNQVTKIFLIVLALTGGALLVNFLWPKYHKEAWLETMDYYKYFGYPAENHYVTTSDGYILQIFRIQAKNTQIKQTGLPVVFLQHGLLDNSDTFFINSEDKAPAFILANAGYDVWMGNNRGNRHSRNHTTYNPDTDKEQFWAFTYDDFAEKDLASMLTYVTNATGQAQLDYIGHSQGTTQMFAALSEGIPEVVSRVRKFLAFGPVTYVNHGKPNLPEYILKLANVTELVELYNFANLIDPAHRAEKMYEWLKNHTIYEIMPFNKIIRDLGIEFCGKFPLPCGKLVGAITSNDYRIDNYDRYDVLAGHDPAGTSFRNMVHWMQLKLSGKFQKFDFGHKENKKRYGVDYPPIYDLSKIEKEVYMFVGNNDILADVTDATQLRNELTGAKTVWWKQYTAGHCSFMWSKDMSHMDDVLQILSGQI